MRKELLHLKQSELAALAGIPQKTLARFERGKHVSLTTQDRVTGTIVRMVAKMNPEAVKKAVQPALHEAEKWERVLSLEPGSELALELEKRSKKSLAELKVMAETLAPFLRTAGNDFLSWIK
jgi:transcriptional regulator with XRE-family HTH domain